MNLVIGEEVVNSDETNPAESRYDNEMKRLAFGVILAAIVVSTGLYEAQARPQYAQKEGKQCGFCHTNPGGGGNRNYRGTFYGANSLSFTNFDDVREAAIAHVPANAEGDAATPRVGYIANVSGPATQQIQLRANRTPLIVVFLENKTTDDQKAAVKMLNSIATSLGRGVAIVGVVKGDTEAALKLTADLGNKLRILPDPDGAAIEKFKATMGLDIVVVDKTGETSKLYSGYSKANLDLAIAHIKEQGVEFDGVDTIDAPSKTLHGGKLGG